MLSLLSSSASVSKLKTWWFSMELEYSVICTYSTFSGRRACLSYLKMGGAVSRGGSPRGSKLEGRVIEAMHKREDQGCTIKSFNSIILKLPKIDENLRKCKATFQDFDEDGNGVIDLEELKTCFLKLEICFPDEEINDLFQACGYK